VKKAFFGYFLYKKFPGQKIRKKNLSPPMPFKAL